MKFALLLLLFAFYCKATTQRPVIGVLAEPTSGKLEEYGSSYIAASYVKWIESGGARAMPIPYDATPEQLKRMFKASHGLLFPGGGVNLDHSQYTNTSLMFLNWATEESKSGGYYPIWGTCLGFELLCVLVNDGDDTCLSPTDSENYSIPLTYADDFDNSVFAKGLPDDIRKILSTEPVTLNNHEYSVLESTFKSNPLLSGFFNILATGEDRKGKTFVTLMESKEYPVYGSQYHPEKVLFEWKINEVINHSFDSIRANSYHNDFFVERARQSQHVFDEKSDLDLLIYKHSPVYTAEFITDFEQCYFFGGK